MTTAVAAAASVDTTPTRLAEMNASFFSRWSEQHQHQLTVGEEMPPVIVPWRLSFTRVRCTEADIRANCQEWILRHLDDQACPHPLAEYICQQSLSIIISTMDRSDYCLSDQAELGSRCRPAATASTGTGSSDNSTGASDTNTSQQAAHDDGESENAGLLDGMKVCQHALTICRKVCTDLLQERSSVSGHLPLNCKWLWNVSAQAIRNRRRKMEDRHLVMPYLEILSEAKSIPPTSLYAVFDGHRGADAAEFSATHLPSILLENDHFESDLMMAMEESLRELDRQFIDYSQSKGNIKAGCTAVIVCVRHAHMYCAWLGDSQLLIATRGDDGARLVTTPHTASSEAEQSRIDALGGICIQASGSWRVSGQLAVSRAIGDCDLKKYLVSDCDKMSVEISNDVDYIVLACDGVWDAKDISLHTMHTTIHQCRTTVAGEQLSSEAAKALVDLARTASDDNITAIVVDMRGYAAQL
ncbi:protein phosphatase 1F-like [Sycon ciliatum]|uniref:protein phosphatase 1F-like n=1 Tax=Sycon ciliatum TaxID=27933 RepID=UPI0031F66FAC